MSFSRSVVIDQCLPPAVGLDADDLQRVLDRIWAKANGSWRHGPLKEAVVATTGGAVFTANYSSGRLVEKRGKSRVLL
jgi:hypothetical protein